MRSIYTLGAFAVVGLIAASAGALDMTGSDTLKDMTTQVVANCTGVTTIKYIGGGSGKGETDMATASQQVAPMSRFLNAGATAACAINGGADAEGLVHSLDGISIIQSRREGPVGQAQCDTNADGICAETCPAGAEPAMYGCKDRQQKDKQCVGIAFSAGTSTRSLTPKDKNGVTGVQCPGCELVGGKNVYVLKDWKDALKLIYAGVHHDGTKACDSDARFTLADEWASFSTKTCQTQRCLKIDHAWRRNDTSGTTDTFLTLLGLPKITTNPFCNGTDKQDNDPIRRTCRAEDQVCAANGTLGMVLPVFVPEGLTGGAAYPQTACTAARFQNAPATTAEITRGTCNDGSPLVSGSQCPVPRAAGFNCINPASNVAATAAPGTDGRVYNLTLRSTSGAILLDSESSQINNAYYRIHTTTAPVKAGDVDMCRRTSSTLQIGCLAEANPCSIGFAGLEATQVSGATSLKVNNVTPTAKAIRYLISDPTSPLLYPLARKLYFNSTKGFENVTGEEAALSSCFHTRSVVDPAAKASGFVTLDDTGVAPVLCEDFNQVLCGASSNTNACANNPF